MGVFQGSRCNSVGNTTSSSLDRRPLPYPACGEREVSTEGLGGYWGQALASLARANPCMSRPPFSNTSCVKVSRQLLAMSIIYVGWVQGTIAYPMHGMPRFTLSRAPQPPPAAPHLSLPLLPAHPKAPQAQGCPKSTEVLSDTMLPSFSHRPP